MKLTPLLLAIALSVAGVVSAETVKDREGAVRQDRAKMEKNGRWIYNDWSAGFAESQRTGKPLMVVLRCVPCMACIGLDAQLLAEAETSPLMNEFVCVRVMNANALDLARFQFDYDLSLSVLFFNGDGTVYARYGSWRHQRDPLRKTTDGFLATLQSVLALHRGYPANKAYLAGKQGDEPPYRSPLDIPNLQNKYDLELDWNANVVKSCVHCHQIGDGLRSAYHDKRRAIPANLIYPWPAPEAVGLTLAADQPARVERVEPGSAAALAGLKTGDDLFLLDAQPVVSEADVSWVLHHAPEAGSLPLVVKRNGAKASLRLTLPKDWRLRSDISRRVGTWPLRGMALGGMKLEALSADEQVRLAVPAQGLGLRIAGLGKYGQHAAARNAGFQENDVLLSMDGHASPMPEGELIGRILQKYFAGDTIDVTVLRGGKKLELKLPIQ